MISFKLFVQALYEAISHADNSLINKNEEIIKTYFNSKDKNTFIPKIINLEYPTLNSKGEVQNNMVQVPLISIVPITSTKIEKATFSADFELEIVDDELQLNFSDKHHHNSNSTFGKLEIVISPQANTEGLNAIIDGYAKALKRQIS